MRQTQLIPFDIFLSRSLLLVWPSNNIQWYGLQESQFHTFMRSITPAHNRRATTTHTHTLSKQNCTVSRMLVQKLFRSCYFSLLFFRGTHFSLTYREFSMLHSFCMPFCQSYCIPPFTPQREARNRVCDTVCAFGKRKRIKLLKESVVRNFNYPKINWFICEKEPMRVCVSKLRILEHFVIVYNLRFTSTFRLNS